MHKAKIGRNLIMSQYYLNLKIIQNVNIFNYSENTLLFFVKEY